MYDCIYVFTILHIAVSISIDEPHEVTLEYGVEKNILFTCTLNININVASIQLAWLRASSIIASASDDITAINLTLSNMTIASDAGLYTCDAKLNDTIGVGYSGMISHSIYVKSKSSFKF